MARSGIGAPLLLFLGYKPLALGLLVGLSELLLCRVDDDALALYVALGGRRLRGR